MPKKTPTGVRTVEAKIREVEDQIDAIHVERDPSEVRTGYELAGLNCRLWSLRRRLYSLKAANATEKKRPGLLARETEADKRHHEWETQRARLANALKVDLLPKVLEQLESQQAAADRLAGLH